MERLFTALEELEPFFLEVAAERLDELQRESAAEAVALLLQVSKETGREHAARDVAGDGRFLHLAHGFVGVVLTEMAGEFLDRLDDETVGFRRGHFGFFIFGFNFFDSGLVTFSGGFHGLLDDYFGFSLHLSHFCRGFFGRDIGGFPSGDLRGKAIFDLTGNFFDRRFDRSRLLCGFRYGRLHFGDDDVGLETPVAGATDLLFPALDRLLAALHLDAGLVALERHVGKSLLMETRDVALVLVMVRRTEDRATETAHRHDAEIPRGRRHFDVFGNVEILKRRAVEQMRDRLFTAQPDRTVGRTTVEALLILRLETHLVALAAVQDHLRKIGHGESPQRLLDVLREPLDSGL